MLIGYARALDLEDEPDVQRLALQHAGCETVFYETASGKSGTKRPELDAVLKCLRPGDILTVWRLDRLGRSLIETTRTIDDLRRRGTHFRSITEQFDSDTEHGRFALQLQLSMVAHFLDLNRQRTAEGVRVARLHGRKGGRPRKLTEGDLAAGQAMLAAGTISVTEIARRLGISRDTFYSYFPQARARSRIRNP